LVLSSTARSLDFKLCSRFGREIASIIGPCDKKCFL
jgi:hypothetical protein